MKDSVGYTVTINIMIIFITIVIAFLCAALVYFKSNKVSNIVTNAIEKYEGYNHLSLNEINIKLSSLGYLSRNINCSLTVTDKSSLNPTCTLINDGSKGYCVYQCNDGNYTFYKVRTNMMINIPIINDILDIPIYSNTNRLFNFSAGKACVNQGKCYVNGNCIATCQ